MSNTFFLDMDGVLADFVDGVERLYDRPTGSLKAARTYELHKALGISFGALSNRIRTASAESGFWLGLRPLPWAHELVRRFNFTTGGANAFILTSPWPADYPCYAQKVEWCMRHLNIGSDRVIPFPHKHLLAAPGRYLLDDLPSHCTQWREAGGRAVLFPASHNDCWLPEFDAKHNLVLKFLDHFFAA